MALVVVSALVVTMVGGDLAISASAYLVEQLIIVMK